MTTRGATVTSETTNSELDHWSVTGNDFAHSNYTTHSLGGGYIGGSV